MKFVMFMIPKVYRPGQEPGEDFVPDAEAVAAMTRYNEKLAQAGALVTLDGLKPPESAVRVSFATGRPSVTRGPFAEATEVIGGYWIIRAASTDAAVEWARQCPAAPGDVIEVRPIFDVDAFPDDVRQASESTIVESAIEE